MLYFGVHILIVYNETGSIAHWPGSGCLSKVTARVKALVKEQMQRNDETTAYQLHQMLVESGIEIQN